MSRAFEIALHQGVRLTETDVWMSNVDLDSDPPAIYFDRTKSGRAFVAEMHPALVPLFRRLKAEGAERAVGFPPPASTYFGKLFRRLGLTGKSFHSTRVTVASELARKGVPISEAMSYINHSSQVIHCAYRRRHRYYPGYRSQRWFVVMIHCLRSRCALD